MNMFRHAAAFCFVASVVLRSVIALPSASAQETPVLDVQKVTTLLKDGQADDIQEAAKIINSHPEHYASLLPQLTQARHPSPLLRSYRVVLRHARNEDLSKLAEGDFDDPHEELLGEIVLRTEQRTKAPVDKLPVEKLPVETAGDLVIQLMKNGDAVTITKIRAILRFRSMGWKIPGRGIDCLLNAIHKDEIVFQKMGTSVQSEIVRTLWIEVPRIEDRLLKGLSHELPEYRAGVVSVLASPLSIRPEIADRLLLMADDESVKVRDHLADGLSRCPHRVDDSVSLLIDYLKQPRLDHRRVLISLSNLAAKASIQKQQAIIDAVLSSPASDSWHSRQVFQIVGAILPRLSDQQIEQRVIEWTPRLKDPKNVDNYLFVLAGVGPKAISAVPKIHEVLARTENLEQQCQIAQGLYQIENDADRVLPIAMKGLSSNDQDTLQQALRLLRLLGPHAKPALPKMIAMVNDSDEYKAGKCILVFCSMGPTAEPAVESIAKFLDHKKITLRVYSHRALKAIGPKAGKAVPQLIAQLDRKKPKNKIDAIEVLQAIGPTAAPALKRLKQLTKTGQPAVKTAAEKAIMQITQQDQTADLDEN